jgi:hypothetical protein
MTEFGLRLRLWKLMVEAIDAGLSLEAVFGAFTVAAHTCEVKMDLRIVEELRKLQAAKQP